MKTKEMLNAINNGLINVINHEKILNETNFFPVADADTGTNLKLSFLPLINNLKISKLDNVKQLILMNASGNSGLIFGAYLIELLTKLSEDKTLKQSFEQATLKSYLSLSNPKEGTILTAFKITSTKIQNVSDFDNIIQYLVKQQLTITKMLNKSSKSVDSGILAFIYFLKGISKYFKNEILTINEQTQKTYNFENDNNTYDNFRYCIQVIVGENINKEQISLNLDVKFDSLVVISSEQISAIHIHSNDINKVMEFFDINYKILSTKVQDMYQEYKLKDKVSNTVIVYDSIGDVNENNLDINSYCIYIPLTIDGVTYQDRLNFSNKYLVQKIKSGSKLTSSQPSVDTIVSLLQKIKNYGYKNVIFISVSKHMSGTYQKLKYAKKYFEQNVSTLNIKILDSTFNSGAMGIIVKEVATYAKHQINFNKIQNFTNKCKNKTSILVNVSDLEPMYLSGRLKRNLYKVISFFKLGAIVTITNGLGKIKVPIFKKSNAANNLLKKINQKNLTNVIISYTTNAKKAHELAHKISSIMTQVDIQIIKTSSIVAGFAGKDALSIGYLEVEHD